jgi:hypothetical protein
MAFSLQFGGLWPKLIPMGPVLVPCLLLSFLRIMDTSRPRCTVQHTNNMYFNRLHKEWRPFPYSCPSGQSNNALYNILVAICKVWDRPGLEVLNEPLVS